MIFPPPYEKPPSYNIEKQLKFHQYRERMRKILSGVEDTSLKTIDKKQLVTELSEMALDELNKKAYSNVSVGVGAQLKSSQHDNIKEGKNSDYGKRFLEIEDNCNKSGQKGTSVN